MDSLRRAGRDLVMAHPAERLAVTLTTVVLLRTGVPTVGCNRIFGSLLTANKTKREV